VALGITEPVKLDEYPLHDAPPQLLFAVHYAGLFQVVAVCVVKKTRNRLQGKSAWQRVNKLIGIREELICSLFL
jgi:hypothetical protein